MSNRGLRCRKQKIAGFLDIAQFFNIAKWHSQVRWHRMGCVASRDVRQKRQKYRTATHRIRCERTLTVYLWSRPYWWNWTPSVYRCATITKWREAQFPPDWNGRHRSFSYRGDKAPRAAVRDPRLVRDRFIMTRSLLRTGLRTGLASWSVKTCADPVISRGTRAASHWSVVTWSLITVARLSRPTQI